MESGLRAVEGEGISGKNRWLWLLTSSASVLAQRGQHGHYNFILSHFVK